jgi:glutamyl/glutaminyl-tRNA synthetase
MVRTRFAPSPTGSLHVGGVRTALYCLLYARRHEGRFVLRIEDTDQVRSTDEAARGILRDLRWCGLFWDEGPVAQSQRLSIYDEYVDKLLASGRAYLAWDSTEELGALRKAAEQQKQTFRYRRRPVSDEDVARYKAEGRKPVVRLAAPDHDVVIDDAVRDEVTVVQAELEDIVIRKADGFPTYHFAVVVDDHLMQITHIQRGAEHLLNTHKHFGVAEALGFELPKTAHLPLINNPAGQKMSKREKAAVAREAARNEHKTRKATDFGWLATLTGRPVEDLAAFVGKSNDRIDLAEAIAKALNVDLPMIEVMDFRRAGYIPEALLNYMALLGWNPGDEREILSVDAMCSAFSLERVNKSAAKFDPAKLRWMNGEYLKQLFHHDKERLLAVIEAWAEVVETPIRTLSAERRLALVDLYKDRVLTLAELDLAASFFFHAPSAYDAKAVDKWLRKDDGLGVLSSCRAALAEALWTAGGIETALAPLTDGNTGRVAQPLRVALTGSAVSPPLFETLAFLDQADVLARIDACLRAHA